MRKLLEVAEFFSLGGSVAGTIAAIMYNQIIYFSAPLTLALSLNLINRHRFQQRITKNTSTAVAQVEQQLSTDVQSIHTLIHLLSPPNTATNMVELQEQVQHNQEAIVLFQTQIAQLNQSIQGLPTPFNPTKLNQQFKQLNQKVEQLQQRANIAPIEAEVQQIRAQMNALAQGFEQLSDSLHLCLSEIDAKILQNRTHLDALSQQFKTRTELQAIEHLERMSEELRHCLEALTNSSATKQELDGLTQSFAQKIEDLSCAFAALPTPPLLFNPENLITQVENLTARVDRLPLSVLQQQLTALQELVAGLDISAAVLHDRTRNLNTMEENLERLQQLTAKLDKKTEHLTLQLVNEFAKTVDVESALARLSEGIPTQIDASAERWVAKTNQLLREINTTYKYELVINRLGSRSKLIEALHTAKQRVIIVCPWLTTYGVDQDVLDLFKALLRREPPCQIDIGWGHLKDARLQEPKKLTRQEFLEKVDKENLWRYSALTKLEELRAASSNLLQLKLLGTHEKFLVCDSSFAMLGSHNVLTSKPPNGPKHADRELGLFTTDHRLIQRLIDHFDSAINLEADF